MENLVLNGFSIYFDHWSVSTVQECKKRVQQRQRLERICDILYLWWVRELDFDPRFDFSHKEVYSHFRKYNKYFVQEIPLNIKTSFIRETMMENIEGILSFQKSIFPKIQVMMISELASELFPSQAPIIDKYPLTHGDLWQQAFHKFLKLHPFIPRHKCYTLTISDFHRLTAILPLT